MHAFLFFVSLALCLGSVIFFYVIPEIMGTLFIACIVFMLISADDWKDRYWTHDIKTDDVLSFAYSSPEKLALLEISAEKQDSLTYSGIWTVADVRGSQCTGTERVGQPSGVIYGPRNPGILYVIGRATRPDYRYLLEKRTPGCVIDYLASKHDVGNVKQASKHYGAIRLSRKKPLPLEAIILERNSVQPLR